MAITCDGEAPEEFSLESGTSTITTITHYFLEVLPRAIKPMTEKTVSFSGNRRIKGAKYSFALQDGTWEFSGDAVAGKGLILR